MASGDLGAARSVLVDVDGRPLELQAMGDPAGRTVVVHHGTPGSCLKDGFFAGLLEEHSLYLVTLSRAGYGRSGRRPGRSVADVVGDVEAALDALGRDRYVAVGWSGGGPHALACAALGAPRCEGAISLAGVAPVDVDFDWTEGMGPSNVEEFELAREAGPAYEAMVAELAAAMAEARGEQMVELYGDLLSEPDRELLSDPKLAEEDAAVMRHAFAQGWGGFYDDDQAFLKPWGFSVQDISVPVEVWYGDEDLMVPPSHGAWLAANIPGARRYHQPAEGHLTIVARHLGELGQSLGALGR